MKDKLRAQPEFNESFPIQKVFIQVTQHSVKEIKNGSETLLDVTKGLPLHERLLLKLKYGDKMKEIDQKFSKILSKVQDEDFQEVHVVVQAKLGNEVKGFLGHAIEGVGVDLPKTPSGQRAPEAWRVTTETTCDCSGDQTEHTEEAIVDFMTRRDWNGTRVATHFFEGSTNKEILEKVEATGLKDLFVRMFPKIDTKTIADLVKMPVMPEKKKYTKSEREALVKKFGEQAIKDLETKMGVQPE